MSNDVESGGSPGDVGTQGRIPWARLGAEMVVIVFSVLLALVLDDARQGREEARLVESVRLSLMNELHANQVALEARLPYHRVMEDTFGIRRGLLGPLAGAATRANGGAPAVPLLEAMGFQNGPGTSPAFARSAWEMAVTSGAVNHMDHSLAFVLSSAYTTQDETRGAETRLLDAVELYQLAAIEGERPVFAIVHLLGTLTDLRSRESDLCDWYVIAGRQLGGDDPPDMGECGSGRVTVR